MSTAWGPDAFRGVAGRSRSRGTTRRVLATIGLAVFSAGLVMLVVFSSAGRGTDVVMVAVGASVATMVSYASVRAVQAALAFREKPRLEALRSRQVTRMGSTALPAPLGRIVQELQFASTSRSHYRRVVAPRLRRLAAPAERDSPRLHEPLATPLDQQIASLGEPGTGPWDRLPERLTKRGVRTEKLEELVHRLEAIRHGESGGVESVNTPDIERGKR